MTRDMPPLAVEGDDPWEKVQIDPATRRLAEHAAAAAGLSIEEWLERAIRRACPSAFHSASAAMPTTPLAAATPIAESPATSRRTPTIAERLAQQRFDDPGEKKAAPSFPHEEEANNGRDRQTEDDRADAPMLAEHDGEEARPLPSSRKSPKYLGMIAVAIALAITAGAVTAQYLIPGHPRVPAVPSNSFANSTPSFAAPTPSNSQPLPNVNNSSSDLSPPADLPPVPGSPSLAPSVPSDDSAPTSLASLPPSPPPAPEPSVAAPAAPSGKAAAAETQAPKEAVPAKTASAAIPPRPGKDDVAPTDPKALAPWLEQRAGNGDAIAQYRLGVLYALGQGVQQDYQHAAQLFKSSAEGGVAEAQYNIAVMYDQGLGIGRDPVQAVQWYQKAAAQGNANAAFNLGVAYSNGVGLQQSMDQAAQWFRRAAAAGIVNAQFNLGLLYERGDGVPVSQVEAYAWYSAAAAHGDNGAAQRRDHLVATLAPSTLKEAQARAQQVAATIKNSGNSASGSLTTGGSARAATPKP